MSILDDIKKSTGFEVLGDGNVKVFTNRGIIKTPLKIVDTIIGGGIPFGTIVDLFGPPASGKSSYGYECMGNFQKQYPNGLPILIDTESSIDTKRIRALGVNPDSMLVLKGATLEAGYKQILAVLKKLSDMKPKDRVPVFILWDSLSNSSSEAQLARENVNGGGIAEAPRINKEYLKQINVYLDKVDAIIFLINQVSAKIGMFVGKGYNESGGNALKHGIHYRLEFSESKVSYDNGIAIEGYSGVSITKNKLGPTTREFPIVVDIMKGGVINPTKSLFFHLSDYLLEKVRGNTHYIKPIIFNEYPKLYQYLSLKYPKLLGKFLWDKIVEITDEDINEGGVLNDFWVLYWANFISKKYSLQEQVLQPLIDRLNNSIDEYTSKLEGWDPNYVYSENTQIETSDDEDEE